MLIAVITAKDYAHAKQQILLSLSQADGIELRLDYWNELDINLIAELRREFKIPMILTLRKKSQGGFYEHSEKQRLEDILELCQLEPEYVDLEYDTPKDILQLIHKNFPDIKLISSYHDFDKMPVNLDEILISMQNPAFYMYKIAVKANSIIDSFKLLKFSHDFSQHYVLTAISMGEYGSCTRILSPIVGSQMSYASLNDTETSAPGQLTLETLNKIYHIRQLNTQSKIYALLGDPVDKSVGHILHNQAIEILKKNAVYIKLQVKQDELRDVIQYCRELPFIGFSITMPLKEEVINSLDSIDISASKINAINSIINDNSKWIGFNTDGLGAINSILTIPSQRHSRESGDPENMVRGLDSRFRGNDGKVENRAVLNKSYLTNKTVVILGAGGAARAIAYEAIQHSAKVIILNRSLERAKKLVTDLGCEAYSFDDKNFIQSIKYNIIINTLPFNILPPDYLPFIADTIAMDIVYNPIITPFLEIAQKSNCICIPGYEMFIRQAILQIQRWLEPNSQDIENIKNIMIEHFKSANVQLLPY